MKSMGSLKVIPQSFLELICPLIVIRQVDLIFIFLSYLSGFVDIFVEYKETFSCSLETSASSKRQSLLEDLPPELVSFSLHLVDVGSGACPCKPLCSRTKNRQASESEARSFN